MESHILWALIMAFSVTMYTIFDGFDLGVGILLPFIKQGEERDIAVNSITPVWDGNETWIVLMGVGMFGGFPNAYSLLLPALYLPVILMVISLALRGVAMEYRFITAGFKNSWTLAFTAGSVMAAFCQGIILGNLMEGIVHTNTPGKLVPVFHFLSPFTLVTGFVLIVSYALIGATWLNFKTSGILQKKTRKIARILIFTLGILLLLIVYGRFHFPLFNPRFGVFGLQNVLTLPSLLWYFSGALLLAVMLWTLGKQPDWLPFTLNIIFTLISAIYILAGFWPFIVPPDLTIYNAGSPAYGNAVLLTSAFVIIPVILTYLVYSYTVFRGKVIRQNNYEPNTPFLHQLGNGARKTNLLVPERPVYLSWPIRMVISLAGMIFFFIVLGFLGNAAALAAIFLFAVIFLFCWWLNTSKSVSSRTGNKR
ncbi:cytochrome d ubiquinol oxidase subunit II [Mucilaginibacter celer]|uniref:Cytochrome d ubiquinol oxidase subunit II n=1 Tax=Mucilaginibacter celer TaxID=2305508 RepID=A0A494VVC7_9SPHI|nr:cytochrome d ubiquinol oxidase subunit II [Mucilaginibacter celer]AYL95393.1 cytochrome d ubiquinol oxidase subunit II [Mucilaginibacter celer]